MVALRGVQRIPSELEGQHLMAEWVIGSRSRLLWYRSSRCIWARQAARSPIASISEKGNACATGTQPPIASLGGNRNASHLGDPSIHCPGWRRQRGMPVRVHIALAPSRTHCTHCTGTITVHGTHCTDIVHVAPAPSRISARNVHACTHARTHETPPPYIWHLRTLVCCRTCSPIAAKDAASGRA